MVIFKYLLKVIFSGGAMEAIEIALKDFEVSVRTKKFQSMVGLFIIIAIALVYYSKALGVSEESYKTPFQMVFLSTFSNAFTYSISLLGLLFGATSISNEIENGTMKILGTKPIYRSQIILGKLLGSSLIIFAGLVIFYILTVAFALIIGFPFSQEDFVRFLITFPFSFLYGLIFSSFGLLISVSIRKSKNVLIMAIFIFIFFNVLLSTIAGVVALAIAGLPPVPELPENALNLTEEELEDLILKDPSYQAWLTELVNTAEKILYTAPNYHYQEIMRLLFGGKPQISEVISAITYNEMVVEDRSLGESLGLIFQNVIMLMIMFLLPLPVSYIKFIRADLR